MSPKIRVIRVFSRLNIGGPSIHVILCTAGLNPQKFESTLVVGQEGAREGNMNALAMSHGVVPVKVPTLGREISLINDLWTTLVLLRLMRRVRPHVVHTHTSKAGFSGRLAARLAGVPVVVHTFHGHVFHGYFNPVITRVLIVLERFLASLSDTIITISPVLGRDLIERKIAPAEKVKVVELGLDLARFLAVEGRSGLLRRELGIGDEVPLVGIIGRLVPIKDHRTFLEAAALASRGNPEIRYVVVGDGHLRRSLEERARELGLADRVYFCGWRNDLPAVYADIDLVVVSSRNEGTPVSIIEGSAARKPVVATRVGGIPDVVEDGQTGILVEPGDPAALSAAILRLLVDTDHAEMLASAGRARVRERFAISRLLTDLEMVYCGLLERKGMALQ